jgi:hypothetical protein
MSRVLRCVHNDEAPTEDLGSLPAGFLAEMLVGLLMGGDIIR